MLTTFTVNASTWCGWLKYEDASTTSPIIELYDSYAVWSIANDNPKTLDLLRPHVKADSGVFCACLTTKADNENHKLAYLYEIDKLKVIPNARCQQDKNIIPFN